MEETGVWPTLRYQLLGLAKKDPDAFLGAAQTLTENGGMFVIPGIRGRDVRTVMEAVIGMLADFVVEYSVPSRSVNTKNSGLFPVQKLSQEELSAVFEKIGHSSVEGEMYGMVKASGDPRTLSVGAVGPDGTLEEQVTLMLDEIS